MRRLPPTLAALATIAALLAANCAEALPLGSRRPPPWFRGWERSVPFVASDYWWWPRYYHGVPNSILISKPFASAQLVTALSNLLNTGTPPRS